MAVQERNGLLILLGPFCFCGNLSAQLRFVFLDLSVLPGKALYDSYNGDAFSSCAQVSNVKYEVNGTFQS